MQSLSGGFAVSDLINSDPDKVKIEVFEQQLQQHISGHLAEYYGIHVASVGCERLMVPETIVAATIDAMIEDRNTLAQEQRSAGLERAGHILSEAQAQSRIMTADARRKAAQIEADATRTAATIYAETYQKNPDLYQFLRELDTLEGVLSRQSTVVLRTDVAPFRMLVEGPQAANLPVMADLDYTPHATDRPTDQQTQTAAQGKQHLQDPTAPLRTSATP
jgi:membrane protease subunit HflC